MNRKTILNRQKSINFQQYKSNFLLKSQAKTKDEMNENVMKLNKLNIDTGCSDCTGYYKA